MRFKRNASVNPLLSILLALSLSCGSDQEEKSSSTPSQTDLPSLSEQERRLLGQMSTPIESAEAELIRSTPQHSLEERAAQLAEEFGLLEQNLQLEELAKHASENSLTQAEPVQFEEINEWHEINPHYVAGYDHQQQLLAIYDLTYQNTASVPFMVRSLLGTIGVADLNLATVIRLLRRALDDHMKKQSYGLASSEEERLSKKVHHHYNEINSLLNQLEKEHGKAKAPTKLNWWKEVKWKNLSVQATATEPSHFRLADIDFSALMKKEQLQEFNKQSSNIQRIFSEKFGLKPGFNILTAFEFIKSADGQYQVYLAQDQAFQLGFHQHQPMKVIDFISGESTFGHALLKLLFQTALKQLVGLIPEPTVATFLKYAVGRWFDLYEQQQSFHRHRALEHINLAQKGEPLSPFSFLEASQRKKAALYILTHEASIFDFIFNKPDEHKWLKSIEQELANVDANLAWANKHNYQVSAFAPLYYQGFNRENPLDRRLFIFGGQRNLSRYPFTAINYERPHLERVRRNLLKTIEGLLDVIDIPIPMVGMIVEQLYNFLVMKNVEKAEKWEARLISYLHLLEERGEGMNYEQELELLYEQRINPFELDRRQEVDFVAKARAFLGLPETN